MVRLAEAADPELVPVRRLVVTMTRMVGFVGGSARVMVQSVVEPHRCSSAV